MTEEQIVKKIMWSLDSDEKVIKKGTKLIQEFARNYHKQQLRIGGVMQWVAVKDELPPVELDVLVWDEFNIYVCNRLDEGDVVWDESTQILDNVTHWMHLPKPPCV